MHRGVSVGELIARYRSEVKGRRGFGCSRYREGCEFVVWKEISGKRLTEKQLHALIPKGEHPSRR